MFSTKLTNVQKIVFLLRNYLITYANIENFISPLILIALKSFGIILSIMKKASTDPKARH